MNLIQKHMNIKQIAKKLPIVPSIYRFIRAKHIAYRLKRETTEEIFTNIFTKNGWVGKESVSGPGSDSSQVQVIIKEIPVLINRLGIKTVLDVPCGDFNWMKQTNLNGIDYIGADIVGDLIKRNEKLYARVGIEFQKIDLIRDVLPTVDLIICRDCLVHLSYNDIVLVLKNVCESHSSYLLTTTFTEKTNNHDILTGMWRPLNLNKSPFNLPHPIEIIIEGCTEVNGAYRDKSLGLWKISDIREHMKNIGEAVNGQTVTGFTIKHGGE
jgi:SAM-dependent methyltransferase